MVETHPPCISLCGLYHKLSCSFNQIKIRLVKIAYEIENLEHFDFLFPCKKPIKFVDFAMSHPVLIRPYLLVVSPPLRIGEAVRSSFMLIWTGKGLRTAREVGDCRNFCLFEYAKIARNRNRRIKVTAVKTPINTSTSTGCDEIPMPEKFKKVPILDEKVQESIMN